MIFFIFINTNMYNKLQKQTVSEKKLRGLRTKNKKQGNVKYSKFGQITCEILNKLKKSLKL